MKAKELTQLTINHYEQNADDFRLGTLDHDVSQNCQALLGSIVGTEPFKILDLGCGPGRDLKYFKELGHTPVGVDGSASFCRMARESTGCTVLQQDFIELSLEDGFFDGIFANASLFHVPKSELAPVIAKLRTSLKDEGVLFSSNPRGDSEQLSTRYANFMGLQEYQEIVESCGFALIHHYYRPEGVPLEERPWLACVFRKASQ